MAMASASKQDGPGFGTHRTRRYRHILIHLLLVGIIAGLIGWINRSHLEAQVNWFTTMRPYMLAQVRPYVLTKDAERALKPLESFRECAKDCPEMIVVPAGGFVMGSPATEAGHFGNEGPQHEVMIARSFAVSKFDVTFAEWDACAAVGGCHPTNDGGYGRDANPVVFVSWDEARQYVTWLSRMTGQPYRLLTEAEWEYAARAGTTTAYWWGDEIGKGNANCLGCGSEWDARQPAPVGSFKPNAFGLYDMHGNVWQWVQDCYHPSYTGAPTDGSAWIGQECSRRVVRGGSWSYPIQNIRAAYRFRGTPDWRYRNLGFRVGRTLNP